MLEAGASAYLLKEGAFDELLDAIQSVLNGQIYLSRGITGVVVEDYLRRRTAEQRPLLKELTPREREILQLIAEGHSTKEIAFKLHISIKIVETHRQHLMDKVDAHSVAELTKFAIREGLTSL